MTGFVYVIRPIRYVGPVKIGFSNQPKLRLASLASWSPIPLEIVAFQPGDIALERRLHSRFARHHSHHEWFHPADEIVAFVSNVENGMSFENAIDPNEAQGTIRKRITVSDDEREYRKYRMRLYFACERLPYIANTAHHDVPSDIESIMAAWKGPKNIGQGVQRCRPTEDQLLTLARFFADPARYREALRSAP